MQTETARMWSAMRALAAPDDATREAAGLDLLRLASLAESAAVQRQSRVALGRIGIVVGRPLREPVMVAPVGAREGRMG